MIFDLRSYTLHNNKFAAWLKLYDQVVHVWKYASQADREKKRSTSFSPV